ncbi:MAG: hypothetical protein CYPHOPRED_001768 [Cyphobasidiales sp. Tagirdzhanova-0007]|nr:MAG: hypothetical protein CYPHOPRED_001768 [Cyphobasidiales sp. Tagirdzhanova-0007]
MSNTTDDGFKKTTQVVGKPQATDHNIADDYVKNPPRNIPGDSRDDRTLGTGVDNPVQVADTVEAKDPKEIEARISGP